MNHSKPPQTKIIREITPQWEEIMKLVAQMKYGQVILKVHNNEVIVVEYTINRRKGEETDGFEVFPL